MLCESCRRDAALRDAEFFMNIGAIIMRFHWSKKGRMCSPCIHSTFWMYTLGTMLLGWWGIISFLVTPFLLIMNIFTYSIVFFAKPYPVDPPRPFLSKVNDEELERYRDEIFQRILKGESMQQVAEDIGARLGISPEEAKTFYNA